MTPHTWRDDRPEASETVQERGVSGLVLSLFPGADLFGMAFEAEGFVVVHGPDIITGRNVRGFHVPPGRFDGIIGGPPCQGLSTYAAMNRAQGKAVADDLSPEFVRCVGEGEPEWFVMENVPRVPTIAVPGYVVQRFALNPRWLGEDQDRERHFQFGHRGGEVLDLGPSLSCLESPVHERACLASEGAAGVITRKRHGDRIVAKYAPRRDWARFCELQGVAPDLLPEGIFTVEGKYRLIGNGVPLPMGRAIARAVKAALFRSPP